MFVPAKQLFWPPHQWHNRLEQPRCLLGPDAAFPDSYQHPCQAQAPPPSQDIVLSLSDCRSNQIFLVESGFAKVIGQLGAKALHSAAIKSLVALLLDNAEAVQTARSQGVADSIARIISSLPQETSSISDIAELKAIFG